MMIVMNNRSALNRTALASNLGRTSARTFVTARQPSFSSFESHPEVEVGDLVTYVEAGNKTEGIVQKIFEEHTKTNERKPPNVAQIQNYYTKKVTYTDLNGLKSVARTHDSKVASKSATSKASTSQAPPKATASQQASKATASQQAPPPIKATKEKEQSTKIKEQVNSDASPLNVDYAVGDIVRYRVAQNFTAGVILDIVYNTTHDEAGNFHGATKENPMAKLENLWTKHISYHHLNVLEHVKRARDVTPGRFAESEYEVYKPK